jgi:holliday junction DNA helicase RuvA
MYDYIKGILTKSTPIKITIETGGIGYLLYIPLNAFNKLPELNTPITCFTSLIIKEDSHSLYGFLSKEERDLFEILISISGIGPKTALALVGHLDLSLFHSAIYSSDIKLISKVPGIGKKTAEKLIIEMRDKIKILEKEFSFMPSPINLTSKSHVSDALNALLTLGYNHLQAQKAINKVLEDNKEETDAGKLISLALKKI